MKKITINGRDFELFNAEETKKTVDLLNLTFKNKNKSLYDVYEKPSILKQEIWEDWLEWFYESDGSYIGINSYNCNMFTITGLVYIENTYYFIYITKCHNKAYKLSTLL